MFRLITFQWLLKLIYKIRRSRAIKAYFKHNKQEQLEDGNDKSDILRNNEIPDVKQLDKMEPHDQMIYEAWMK